MKGNCVVCGKEIEVKMCCSGRDCGCGGQPIDPPVCDSNDCYDELMNNIGKYFPKNRKLVPFNDEFQRKEETK